MTRFVARTCIVVLLQIIVSVSCAQDRDSSLVFAPSKNMPALAEPVGAQLSAIASLGIGAFRTFNRDGAFESILQPTLAFDFLAEPDGVLHFLLGGRIGFSDPLSAEASFGLRFPVHEDEDKHVRIFADLSLLFYADSNHAHPPGPGIRAAFGAKTVSSIDLEYRLAGEWRGTKSTDFDENRTRSLWWIGAEVAISFPLVSAYRPPTRLDSLRAALQYIATPEQMEQLDKLGNNSDLDNWLEDFWKHRDMTPGTYLNEVRIEYERRVALANKLFSRPKRMGVRTDAGRVYVIYGAPDDTEGATSTVNETYGYRLWIYRHRIASTPIAVFLFHSDGPREWQQVFSNVPGELSGPLPQGLPATMTRWIQ